VDFLTIYVLEAHAADEWWIQVPEGAEEEEEEEATCYMQPTTLEARLKLARKYVKDIGVEMPTYVDSMNDLAAKSYNAVPDRLYIIDTDGTVAYAGGPGPSGYRPKEVYRWIAARFGRND